ncbi:MAG: Cthe_2314 family HEPN domain-containing protein [Candidatus Cohnella colombiensis]|uniref:Cthe_2314 family HEPN domain-containing protein n=1 Tax=Candidatus Cohnella colombiensis TaxID=3121368 RepID=A0AA95JCC0_9BACL|nr:MAG: Cthe_2314 family HEPN domain-containing protein [Cohnella sp.]
MLFGEQPREWSGSALETVQLMEKFIAMASKAAGRKVDEHSNQFQTYAIWAEGLLRSLDELEQSIYAAKRYATIIPKMEMNELSDEDLLNYNRHVYYDKNTYIRVFALLDKLGTFLNELLQLETERMKSRFSYFTVLRNMRMNRVHRELAEPLGELKEQHNPSLGRLRSRRNTEIHYMNAELQDDLKISLSRRGVERRVEDFTINMMDLDHAWSMVEQTLNHCFRYACRWLRARN